MPNIASVLKEEIVRLARKEGRGQTEKLKQESVRHRKEIVALKRQVAALERQVQRLGKAAGRAAAAPQAEEEAGPHLRFSASGFAAKRKRLGLSAAEAAALLGVSAQSVYKWEHGGARPPGPATGFNDPAFPLPPDPDHDGADSQARVR